VPPTFAQLGVPPEIVRALDERGIIEPFEIQAATIADALAGRDVCGKAPTGSGKTLAFGIPLVANINPGTPKHPRGLILAPTRELADQIHDELRSFAGKVRTTVVYGGVGYGPQVSSLRKGVDILVACPGRLEDLIARGDVSLSKVETVVLDEADRMADMGFLPAVRRILDLTRGDRQTVLFSATLDGDVAKLTKEYQNKPAYHEIGDDTPDVTSATHFFWRTDRADRVELAAEAVKRAWPAIVFVRTRHGADRIAKQMSKYGVDTAVIHGSRSQNQRTRALADFTSSKAQALIATDVAARGIHVDNVALVVHFDPPEDHKTYIHRSGRTARAGQGGMVLSLVQGDQAKDVRKIQRLVGLPEGIQDALLSKLGGEGTASAPRRERPATLDENRIQDDGRRKSGNRAGGGGGSRSNGTGGGGSRGKTGAGGGRGGAGGGRGKAGGAGAGRGKPATAGGGTRSGAPKSRRAGGSSGRPTGPASRPGGGRRSGGSGGASRSR
jgi:superfamily II DNA/RNA helicase